MSDSGSPTTTTTATATPNVFDIEKGKNAELMNSFLMTNISQGLKGEKGPLDDASTQNILNQLRQNAGRYNISPGSNTFQQASNTMAEASTMPNMDIMSLAMSLYGQSQPASGMAEQSSISTVDDPMAWIKQYQQGKTAIGMWGGGVM